MSNRETDPYRNNVGDQFEKAANFSKEQSEALQQLRLAFNRVHKAFEGCEEEYALLAMVAVNLTKKTDTPVGMLQASMLIGTEDAVINTVKRSVENLAQRFWDTAEDLPLDLVRVVAADEPVEAFLASIKRHVMEGNGEKANQLIEQFPPLDPNVARHLARHFDEGCPDPGCLACRTRDKLKDAIFHRAAALDT